MKTQLDKRNIELAKILFTLKQSIDLEKILGLNADYIKSTGCGIHFFSHVQKLAIDSCIIIIYKIFEKEKQHSLNSIPSILKFIDQNDIKPFDSDVIDVFVKKYEKHKKTKGNYTQLLENICLDFYNKHHTSFKRFTDARNKIVAHAEHDVCQDTVPSHAVMKDFLLFGIEFYQLITDAYIENVSPYSIQDNTSIFLSTYNVLKKLGIENIKTKFEK